jgi:hypothetical protein
MARSSAMREGSVGRPVHAGFRSGAVVEQRLVARFHRQGANFRLESVYSWVQHTRVSSAGRRAGRARPAFARACPQTGDRNRPRTGCRRKTAGARPRACRRSSRRCAQRCGPARPAPEGQAQHLYLWPCARRTSGSGMRSRCRAVHGGARGLAQGIHATDMIAWWCVTRMACSATPATAAPAARAWRLRDPPPRPAFASCSIQM